MILPVMSLDLFLWAGILIFSYVLIRVLDITSPIEGPEIVFQKGAKRIQNIWQECKVFKEPYIPTLLYGKNGHIQTIIYGLLDRLRAPLPLGTRKHMFLEDRSLVTFDVFDALKQHDAGDFTLAVCPGIANSSESVYLKTFSYLAQQEGYRVAILNHLGALPNVELKTPRIFNYGCTEEYGAMISKLQVLFPETRLIAVGFSLGGNIITKYLGEDENHQKPFICGISICQGYDAEKAIRILSNSWSISKGYYWTMALRMKRIFRQHQSTLSKGKHFDLQQLMSSNFLWEFDERYTSKVQGFQSLEEFYRWCSCCHYIQNITIPMLLLNAADDPVVPQELYEIARQFATENDNILFVLSKYGGHLGFFEGGVVLPNSVTWLDRAVVDFANATVKALGE